MRISGESKWSRIERIAHVGDQKIVTFHDKFPLVGPLVWLFTIWYLVAQIWVAAEWKAPPYSWTTNSISDLGDTACPDLERHICSPDHTLMNASFMLIGALMVIGAPLIFQEFRGRGLAWLGFTFMGCAGLGTIGVGLFAENVHHSLHVASAGAAFLLGNLALLVLARELAMSSRVRIYTGVSGAVGLLGLAGLGIRSAGVDLGLGLGLIERLAAYPQTLWLLFFGAYMCADHYLDLRRRTPH